MLTFLDRMSRNRCFRLGKGAWIARALAVAALALTLGACSSSDGPRIPDDAIVVGLLLPFTGFSTATANNFERAALFAEQRVAEAGGINGRPFRILSADTHSNSARARRSVEDLVAAGATAVVGPESAEIAAEIAPYLAERGVTFLSPLIGAANNQGVDCSAPWFRLAPSARDLGEALAKQIIAANVETIAVMYAHTAYDEALRDALIARFAALSGRVVLTVALEPDDQSYTAAVSEVRAANADAVVLTSPPRTGAQVVSEFELASGSTPVWFLSPLLKTDLLVQNVVPDALEGARGVAPKIYETGQEFPDAFSQRWGGDEPLEGANFYYDSVALLAFAMNSIAHHSDQKFDSAELDRALRSVSAPPGASVGWDDIASGLARQREGAAIYYSGLTGPLLFRNCGERAYGASSQWHVHAGSIVTDAD